MKLEMVWSRVPNNNESTEVFVDVSTGTIYTRLTFPDGMIVWRSAVGWSNVESVPLEEALAKARLEV